MVCKRQMSNFVPLDFSVSKVAPDSTERRTKLKSRSDKNDKVSTCNGQLNGKVLSY